MKEKDIWDYLTPKENLNKIVAEKYDDYKYPFDKYGLGIISCSHNYNDISNYFHRDLRLNCSSYGFKSPLDVWNNGDAKDIWRILVQYGEVSTIKKSDRRYLYICHQITNLCSNTV